MKLIFKNDDGTEVEVPGQWEGRVQNASKRPEIFYAMHFSEGVAEYRERGQTPYRVLINEGVAKQMDATFPGCPVVVLHTDEELDDILPKIMEVADGFVVESFFNQADGKHWAKILAITDKAHDAIRKGWAVSNCYKIMDKDVGGMWHGVDFQNEVKRGRYEHLAIVPNPRYESKILTPEQFKAYNQQKELELQRLANSHNEGEVSMKFNFFRKQKVEKLENAADLEGLTVTLPLSKKEMTVGDALNALDKIENMQGYCNMDHMVKIGDEEMSVNDLVGKYSKMNADKASADEAAAEGAGAQNDDDAEDEEADVENEEDDAEKKKKEKAANAADEKAEALRVKNAAEADRKAKKAKGKDHFDALANAADLAALKNEKEKEVMETERSQIARGQDRYGSKK